MAFLLQDYLMDPVMRSLFKQVGLTEKLLTDDVAAFLYDFIEQNGGVEALKKQHIADKRAERARTGPRPPPPPQRR